MARDVFDDDDDDDDDGDDGIILYSTWCCEIFWQQELEEEGEEEEDWRGTKGGQEDTHLKWGRQENAVVHTSSSPVVSDRAL